MKTFIVLIAAFMAIGSVALGQDVKAGLRDFTPKYSLDTFQLNGEASHLRRRVVLFQKAQGIRSAYWDEDSQLMTVQYNNRVVALSSIKNFFFKDEPLAVLKRELRFTRPVVLFPIQPPFKTSKK